MALRLGADTTGGAAASRDRSLQTARRLDWRFLLPDPRLDHVAYLGPGEDGLLPALQAWSPLLAVMSGRGVEAGAGDNSVDVAVVQSPHRASLARAAAVLRDGGWLYCEIGRRTWLRRPTLAPRRFAGDGGPHGLRQTRSALGELGFHDVETHWHHPSFERCGWMIPLGGGTSAVTYLLARSGGPLGSPRLAAAAGWMLGVGDAVRVLPCLSLIARKGRAA